MDWSEMDSLFLDGMMAGTFTAIIIKTFEDLRVKKNNYAKVVFGVLVIEDVVAILFMVILSVKFAGGKLLELAWRKKYGVNIAYIERGGFLTARLVAMLDYSRNGESITNLMSTFVFEHDDIVWIVGERKRKIKQLLQV